MKYFIIYKRNGYRTPINDYGGDGYTYEAAKHHAAFLALCCDAYEIKIREWK